MSGPGKLDLVYRKQLDELTATFEGALASFGGRLTRLERAVRELSEQHDGAWLTMDTEVGNVRKYVEETQIDSVKMFLDVAERIARLHAEVEGRRFTVRVRALLRKLLWTRNGSPPSLSVTSSLSPSRFPLDTASDIGKAWEKPSEQYPIF